MNKRDELLNMSRSAKALKSLHANLGDSDVDPSQSYQMLTPSDKDRVRNSKDIPKEMIENIRSAIVDDDDDDDVDDVEDTLDDEDEISLGISEENPKDNDDSSDDIIDDDDDEILPEPNRVSYKKRKKETEEPKDSEEDQSTRKQMIALLAGVTVAIVALVLIVSTVFGKSDDAPQSQTSSSTPEVIEEVSEPVSHVSQEPTKAEELKGTVVLKNQQVDKEPQRYGDTLEIEKRIRIQDGTVTCFVQGIPENFNDYVYIPVTVEQYNALEEGYLVDISYEIIQFNGLDYMVDVRLEE